MNKITYKNRVLVLIGLFTVFVASFGDEVIAFTFSFAQVNNFSMINVSMLMSCTLIGGLCASPLSMFLLHKFKTISILNLIFFTAGFILVISSYYNTNYIFFIVAFILGTVNGVFWSILSVLIPQYFDKHILVEVNKAVQSIRNAGYLTAPFLAGILSSKLGVRVTILLLASIFLLAIPCAIFFTKTISEKSIIDNHLANDKIATRFIPIPRLFDFFRLPRMKITLLPLIVTICTTSTFNVAFMYLMIIGLNYSKSTYGVLLSAISLGLVVGPILLASYIKKWGINFGACFCATIIGICIFLASIYQSIIWLYLVLFVLGVANGLQNTLMASFVMQVVPECERKKLMPTYMFIIQLSVLTGFLLAGQIKPEFAKQLLIVSGIIASVFGAFGAISNLIIDKIKGVPY